MQLIPPENVQQARGYLARGWIPAAAEPGRVSTLRGDRPPGWTSDETWAAMIMMQMQREGRVR